MIAGSRLARIGAVALLASGCGSTCERGGLAKRIDAERSGVGTPGVTGRAWTSPSPYPDLAGTDCSDGLVRCRDGVVEASRRAVVPHPCVPVQGEGAKSCACPWDVVGKCVGSCAADEIEVVASPAPTLGAGDSIEADKMQLCRSAQPVARAVLPGDPFETEVCSTAEIRCASGIVRVCDGAGLPSRAHAACFFGCARGIGVAIGEGPWANGTVDGAVMILCRRDDAERR